MKNMRRRLVDSILDGNVDVTVYSNTKHLWSFTTQAKIDTGADRSSIDDELAIALRLRKIDEIVVRNANGRKRRPVYAMDIDVNGIRYEIEVNGSDRSKLVYPIILGRLDLLEICEEE